MKKKKMRTRTRQDETSKHGPREEEVQRFTELLLASMVVNFLFWVAILQGPLLLVLILGSFVAARMFSFRFYTRGSLWIVIFATVLVVPLYYLHKNIERRLDEVRYQLEQVGVPESSEDPNTSSSG